MVWGLKFGSVFRLEGEIERVAVLTPFIFCPGAQSIVLNFIDLAFFVAAF